MRKFILASILCLFAVSAFSQAPRRFHFRNVYTTVDTLIVKGVQFARPNKDGDYLITLQNEQNLIIAYNSDHTKAIVLHGYAWGKRMEFNVKYNEARLVLWYKDEHIYCGYIYDTKHKACQYFEAINESEKDRLVKRFKFLERMPTFTEIKNGED
jgi:hypothetical protein